MGSEQQMGPLCEVFIFSFNRGPYLKNCVAALGALAPDLPVTVVDDGSTDPETVAILNALPVPVVQPGAVRRGRLGGLYSNMQWALEAARLDLALFLQDDVQMVRAPDAQDRTVLEAYFAADPAHVFVNPTFRMGPRMKRLRPQYQPWPPYRGYRHDSGAVDQAESSRRWFFDVALCHAARLKADGWGYAPSERANARQASERYAPMLHMADPFICQLPEVATLRFGRRTLGARWAEHLAGPEVQAFAPLSGPETEALRARPLASIPLAEDVLRTCTPHSRRPFVHKGVNARWYTRALNKLELLLRR